MAISAYDSSSKSFSVWREVGDFDWLRERLARDFPGLYLPPLPQKHYGYASSIDSFYRSRSTEANHLGVQISYRMPCAPLDDGAANVCTSSSHTVLRNSAPLRLFRKRVTRTCNRRILYMLYFFVVAI